MNRPTVDELLLKSIGEEVAQEMEKEAAVMPSPNPATETPMTSDEHQNFQKLANDLRDFAAETEPETNVVNEFTDTVKAVEEK